MLVVYLWFLVFWGSVGLLFSRAIHRYNLFGAPQHIPTGRYSVVALRALGAVFLLAGLIGLWLRERRE